MKKVLITGAGRGIGLALTKEFLAHGYQVIGTYRDAQNAKELLQLAQDPGKVVTVAADVTDEKSLGPLKDLLRKQSEIDLLINNSGVIGQKSAPLSELHLDEVMDVFQVNTLGPMRVSRAALPFLKKNGTIAQITSLMGSIADNGGGYYDYRMSKAALNMFNSCLAKEFPGLTCLALHPGWVQTDMGGKDATVTTEDCAKGLFKVITQANSSQSGQFFDYTGKKLPW